MKQKNTSKKKVTTQKSAKKAGVKLINRKEAVKKAEKLSHRYDTALRELAKR